MIQNPTEKEMFYVGKLWDELKVKKLS